MALDELEELRRVEALHDDRRRAEPQRAGDTLACGAEWYSGAGDR